MTIWYSRCPSQPIGVPRVTVVAVEVFTPHHEQRSSQNTLVGSLEGLGLRRQVIGNKLYEAIKDKRNY